MIIIEKLKEKGTGRLRSTQSPAPSNLNDVKLPVGIAMPPGSPPPILSVVTQVFPDGRDLRATEVLNVLRRHRSKNRKFENKSFANGASADEVLREAANVSGINIALYVYQNYTRFELVTTYYTKKSGAEHVGVLFNHTPFGFRFLYPPAPPRVSA